MKKLKKNKSMKCTNCDQTIAEPKAGFVVCEHCGTVNAPPSTPNVGKYATHHTVNDGSEMLAPKRSLKPNFSKFNALTKLQQRLALGGVAALVVISSITGGFALDNHKAAVLLSAAKTEIHQGDYEGAANDLAKAAGHHTFGDTHSQIATLTPQDNVWVVDAKNLQQGKHLFSQQKYAEADKSLLKIHKTFPKYSQVTDLRGQIKSKLAELDAAAKAAAAQKAVPIAKKPAAVVASGPKRFTSMQATAALAAANNVTEAQTALQSFVGQYNLTMRITSIAPSSYVKQYDTFDLLSDPDLANLKAYGAIFIDEWAKYPTDWVHDSNLQSVMLVKNLAIQGTKRAATPDPFGHAMYYDVGYGAAEYAREVVHHEYDHLIEYNYFNSYSHSDPTWQSYNTPGFSYGSGGASCYGANSTCLTGEHPIQGFVTGYSASAIEEDKAEIYGYLMTTDDYHHMQAWLASDSYLANKVAAYKQFVASHSPEMAGAYFDQINP